MASCTENVKFEAEFKDVFELREFLARIQELESEFPNVKVTFEEL